MNPIDLRSSLRDGNSSLLKKLPGFLVGVMEKIIRQDEMNAILHRLKDCPGPEFPGKALTDVLKVTLDVEGLENLPKNGRCFLVANHPFGMVDGLILAKLAFGKYNDIRITGNEAVLLVPNLRPYMAKVNVYGRTGRESVMELEKIYQGNLPLINFPAGEVSRKYNGKVIRDTKWQKSFVSKSVSCQRDVVPIYFHGRNSRLFHGIYSFRKLFRIGLNIELMLLPREMFLKRNKSVKVTIGKPIAWQYFDSRYSHAEWAEKVKDFVYSFADPGSAPREFKV